MSAVRAAFFSMTSGAVSGDDEAYLRWHLLDHLPEQYTIAGIRLGTRWLADDACRTARLAQSDELAPVRSVLCYLLAAPIDETLIAFARLGRTLREAGRYPEPATAHLLGAYELGRAEAAPSAMVSSAALPFRPHRGVYVIVEQPGAADGHWRSWCDEEHVPAVLAVDGVAGVSEFRTSPELGTGADQGTRFEVPAWDPRGRRVTVIHLDGDVLATAERLEPLVRHRWSHGTTTPELAGPFHSMVTYEAWPLPHPSPPPTLRRLS